MTNSSAIDLALLILRVGVGGVMFAHGANHIWGGGKITGTAGWFESLGMKPGRVHAWLASIAELLGGIALVAGLLTPLGGASVVGVMIVAWVTNHLHNGFFIFRPGEGWEYVMTLTLCGIAISALGPGSWSLDHALGIRDDLDEWTGLLIAAVAGGGGAALVLATSWRPPPSD